MRVCPHDFGDFLAIFEEDKGWHGADAEFLGYIGDFVDIDFEEADIGIFFGETGKIRLVLSLRKRL